MNMEQFENAYGRFQKGPDVIAQNLYRDAKRLLMERDEARTAGTNMRCGNCRWMGNRGDWGPCKRHAPVVFPVMNVHTEAADTPRWPFVDGSDCCGDWEPAK